MHRVRWIGYTLYNQSCFISSFTDVGSTEGIAYDETFNDIYWTSYTNSSISRFSLSADDPVEEVIIRLTPTDHPRGIALDICDEWVKTIS